jgi:hypothetical protein
MMDAFFAHQGGWDEILMFVIPAGLAIFGLRWAERRARRRAEEEDSSSSDRSAPDGDRAQRSD